jgi:glyoxylase-like metal-dependent hydrolase (beta-lactamase superfamily II)
MFMPFLKKVFCSRLLYMHVRNVGRNMSIIDLETGGFRNLIASYVLAGNKTAVIETGPTSSINKLLTGLEELGVQPQNVTCVAVTHVHIDHSGGAGTLLEALPNAKVLVHRRGAPHLINPTRLWEATKTTLGDVAEIMGEPKPISEERVVLASEGLTIDLGKGLKLMVTEAPGHAAHSVSYYESLNEGIFPGDSAGAYLPEFDTVFPTTPPPFRPDIAAVSLDKLISLKPKTLFYSHFGEAPDAVMRLRNYQVQIRRWLSIVMEGVKRGNSDEAIREAVLAQDETIQKAVPALRGNPVHRKTLIENSVRGFIEFAKNPQI